MRYMQYYIGVKQVNEERNYYKKVDKNQKKGIES
jgi:hypothetical protein